MAVYIMVIHHNGTKLKKSPLNKSEKKKKNNMNTLGKEKTHLPLRKCFLNKCLFDEIPTPIPLRKHLRNHQGFSITPSGKR